MSLENLLKIGQLKPHASEAAEIERLLVAARRNLRDARVTSISPETRFDAAYKAIMQSALAALMMHGYRPDTNRPGHHMTVIQSLPLTIGIDARRIIVLDTLRRQRNVADYTGDDVRAAVHCRGRTADRGRGKLAQFESPPPRPAEEAVSGRSASAVRNCTER